MSKSSKVSKLYKNGIVSKFVLLAKESPPKLETLTDIPSASEMTKNRLIYLNWI